MNNIVADVDFMIEEFSGNFDGNGNTITVNINAPGRNNVGLFGIINSSGTIDNLTVAGSVHGGANIGDLAGVGGLAGINAGTINASAATCTVTGGDAGGLVGHNAVGGTIIGSFASGTVLGTSIAGGLIGYIAGGIVENSYSTGTVNGEPCGLMIGFGAYASYVITLDVGIGLGAVVVPSRLQTGTDGRLGYPDLPTPTRSGYSFDAWYTASHGGVKVTTGTDGTVFMRTGEPIYARWLQIPAILPRNFPDGTLGVEYTGEQFIANGELPISWTLEDGNLPDGLTLASDGYIQGIPTVLGTFHFTVRATNVAGYTTQQFSITIKAAPTGIITIDGTSGANNDGVVTHAVAGNGAPPDGSEPFGGFPAIATGNSVTVNSGANISGDVYGGNSFAWSTDATATANSVIITGGIVNGAVIGGSALVLGNGDATASGNSVTISGSLSLEVVVGGAVSVFYGTGIEKAIHNTVTISGSPTIGYLSGGGYASDDGFTGNSLNVIDYNGTITEIVHSFQYINFTVPSTQTSAVLKVDGDVYLGDFLNGASTEVSINVTGDPLSVGDQIILIEAGALHLVNFNQTTYESGEYLFTLEIVDNSLIVNVLEQKPITNVNIQQAISFKVYPNPVVDELHIENGELKAGELITIYDVSGSLVLTYMTSFEKTRLNVSHLPNGVYLVKMGGYTKRIVKQ